MKLLFFLEGYRDTKGFFEKNIVNVTWKKAVLIAFLVGIFSAFIMFFVMNFSADLISSLMPFWKSEYVASFNIFFFIVTPFVYPLGLLFYAGFFYIIALILGGKGEFKIFYMLLVLILLMLLPFQLIASFIFFSLSLLFPEAGLPIYIASVIMNLPILLYGVYLLTQALKISLNMSPKRAVLVWLIPAILWFFVMVMLILSLFVLQANPILGGQMQSPCSNEEYYTISGISLVLFDKSPVNRIRLSYESEKKFDTVIETEGNSALKGLIGLSCLEHLDLGRTQISDISALSELTKLESINLNGTNITNLFPLSNMANLEELHLFDTSVSDISPLRNLTNLKKLTLYQTKISIVSDLSQLKNMEELNLSSTSVSDISILSNMTNLKKLNLTRTSISDVSQLSGLTNLKELYLNQSKVTDISPLEGLNITHLDLSSTNIPDLLPLKELKSLTHLWLGKTVISTSQLSALKQLKNLRVLDLHDSISDADCEELKRELPNTIIYKALNTKC